jgi:predicted nucleic acid-binding protein
VILVDTSVWVDHLRRGDDTLTRLLEAGEVLMHPHVLGELACGNLRNRKELLYLLAGIPSITVASEAEALEFIERRKLMGKGIGYTDVHLLAATTLHPEVRLWTRDFRLRAAAATLGINFAAV